MLPARIPRRRSGHVTDAERVSRYAYLLQTLPHALIERIHTPVFAELLPEQRAMIIRSLRPTLSEPARSSLAEDPSLTASLVRHTSPHDEVARTAVAAEVADRFLRSPAVAAFFRDGVGSVEIDRQPPWVHELVRHESAPVDAGRLRSGPQHRWFP